MRNRTNVFTNLDWVTILTYLVLVIIGWLSIYAAVYNEEHSKIFDLSQRYGNQLLWIGFSLLVALIILMIEGSFFTSFAYPIYGFVILMLIGVLLFGTEIKGAKSWFRIGSFAIQPAEFGKFATALALAKFLSVLGINMKDLKTKVTAIAIVILPAMLILLQNDTGSMLVYFSFIIVLYREGLSGNVLLSGIYTAFLFITSLLMRIHTFTFFDKEIGGELLLILILVGIGAITIYFTKKMKKLWIIIIAVLICSIGVVFSVDYVFNNVLEPHQSKRINVMLGVESDPHGAGYNVNQSLIAIGSGGFSGKGFLNGTQTKFNFVPEQSTDFIFCTIGEEWGFLGTFVLISLYLFLFLRLIFLAERQRSTFSRIYGYCVASILFFHFLVNIGMTIGLAPVIGIPLPFISYGGSSLWAFTILLFIFIRLDAERIYVLR
ncbi:MAG: rod shape-determining protein RodA [Flavobacteriales bacterium]|nr:rod shape-determining protein RodA [Flavobacteriales bacterium]MCW8913972.1 rod shape-determining protein RodA [Flavobacteriales bacterium]MCW8938858.1 rod shape-determining protein RodA [Flavobacteriales bacterium]MCW8941523.1 rod shape-determining protein RodA [Flavobacteriales bacterium]MCW8967443.1 rod shape-determining protein RodA [Flavobacteriales bacterium]